MLCIPVLIVVLCDISNMKTDYHTSNSYINEYNYRIAFDMAFGIYRYFITEHVDGLADTKS